MPRALSVAVVFLVALCALPAEAQQHRVLVLPFEGQRPEALRRLVVSLLERHDVDVVDVRAAERTARALGSHPTSEAVSAELGVQAIVEGDVARAGRRVRLRLRVLDATAGRELATEAMHGATERRLRSVLAASLWDRLGYVIAAGSVPPRREHSSATQAALLAAQAEAADEVEAPDEVPSARAEPAAPPPRTTRPPITTAGLAFLVAALGPGIMGRELTYQADALGNLRDYSLPTGATLRLAATWYPAIHFGATDALAHLGLLGEVRAAVGLVSLTQSGAHETEAWDWAVGVDARIPLGVVELGLSLAYSMQRYALGVAQDGDRAPIPDIEYQALRPMLRARFDLGLGLFADARFGWLALLATGELSAPDWFPRNTGSGLELGFWAGWESDLGLGFRVGMEMRHFLFGMHSEAGDAHIADSGSDRYLSGTLDLVYRAR